MAKAAGFLALVFIFVACSSNRHGYATSRSDGSVNILLFNEGWGDPHYENQPKFTEYRDFSFTLPHKVSGTFGPVEIYDLSINGVGSTFVGTIKVDFESRRASVKLDSARNKDGVEIPIGKYNGDYLMQVR